MDIVMLGHSGAGKTTYVSLMYESMREGVEGFSLRTAETYEHRVLTKAARGIRRGRYPDPSNQRALFNFVLQHDGKDVYPFTWRDYRGGALRERSDSSQASELRKDLDAADAIVIFADAHQLATNGGRARMEARALVSHVLRALDTEREGAVAVIVVFTKCDLIAMDDDSVIEAAFQPYEQLLEAVARSDSAVGNAVPVACGPQPVNVEVPVLLCLYVGLLSRAATLQATIENNLAQAKHWADRDTLSDRFISWLSGVKSNAEIGASYFQQAMAEYARLEPLIEPAQRLEELIKRVYGD